MDGDSNWVEEVRRWCSAGKQPAMQHAASAVREGHDDSIDLGYEAANPALQSRHWPDAPTDDSGNLK